MLGAFAFFVFSGDKSGAYMYRIKIEESKQIVMFTIYLDNKRVFALVCVVNRNDYVL